MTYLTFLLVFLVPPILLLALVQPRPLAGRRNRRGLYALPLTCLIAFVYTTPWDNYLVYRGVWGYGTARVVGTIFYVPVEEYLFFILQPLLTGLLLYLLLGRSRRPEQPVSGPVGWIGGAVYGALTAAGAVLLLSGWERGLYLGLILGWAGPVLLGMWIYAGRAFWRLRRPALTALTAATIYLWIADRTAIRLGIWDISDRFSLGFDPLGLPVEEAVFFLVTNLLVVQGVLLFLYGDRIGRPEALLS